MEGTTAEKLQRAWDGGASKEGRSSLGADRDACSSTGNGGAADLLGGRTARGTAWELHLELELRGQKAETTEGESSGVQGQRAELIRGECRGRAFEAAAGRQLRRRDNS
ncbi:hypothetical protein CRG98_045092 [Punica granatum]|uniref:Uncharacterized protein n=1 Tax=Punica granatum TaxID=22663 RepID=A0A2I0HS69_PUNGR|nr:hypothetical protein CRG98_045092 [Punica granatum]